MRSRLPVGRIFRSPRSGAPPGSVARHWIVQLRQGTGRGPFESASLCIGPSGTIVVTTGATAQGQGVKSMLAQIAAGVLGVRPADIRVIDGDTDASPLGLGAFASRQAVMAGNALFAAATRVADKARAMAAHMLEAAPDDLEFSNGTVFVKGVPEMKVTLAAIAKALGGIPASRSPAA